MAIERSLIGTTPLNQATDVAIQMVSSRPSTSTTIDPPVTPNVLLGYYDGFADRVELYVTNAAGNRYLRV